MEYIEITGGSRLFGDLHIQGSKNLALPAMAACILHRGTTVLHNCPKISDVRVMCEVLESLGVRCSWEKNTLIIDAGDVFSSRVDERFGKTMRSTITLAGSLLGRTGGFEIPYPGGCVIGCRPIDFHLRGFGQMGTEITENETIICGRAKRLAGALIRLPFPSVGATENLILAAVLADGTTIIESAAKEPEIEGLCSLLSGMGARIEGAGTDTIRIDGVKELCDSEFMLWGDRIVAGTYLLAAAGSGGEICLKSVPPSQLENLRPLLLKMGAGWRAENDSICLNVKKRAFSVSYVRTSPYPGFSTDLQSQLLAVLSTAQGKSIVEETIFEARFKIVEALKKMGAEIIIEGKTVSITGVEKLHAANLEAYELRGGAALVVAGMMAEGKSIVRNPYFIDRGYENICSDLAQLGAVIRRKKDEQT